MKKQYFLRVYTSSKGFELVKAEVTEAEFFRVITETHCSNAAIYPQIMPNTIVNSVICESLLLDDIKYKRIVL